MSQLCASCLPFLTHKQTDASISFGLVLLNKETSFSLPPSVEKGQPHSSLSPLHLIPNMLVVDIELILGLIPSHSGDFQEVVR